MDHAPYLSFPGYDAAFPDGDVPDHVRREMETRERGCERLAADWSGRTRDELRAMLTDADARLQRLRGAQNVEAGPRVLAVEDQIAVLRRLLGAQA